MQTQTLWRIVRILFPWLVVVSVILLVVEWANGRWGMVAWNAFNAIWVTALYFEARRYFA